MDAQYAKQIFKALADGVSPMTGEVLAKNDSCNEPDVIRALYWVLNELEKAEKRNAAQCSGRENSGIWINELEKKEKRKEASLLGRENAGRPWTKEDEQMLCIMFDRGDSKKEICDYFKRSERGISARLVKLGKIQAREVFENRQN